MNDKMMQNKAMMPLMKALMGDKDKDMAKDMGKKAPPPKKKPMPKECC